jgi:hypothetical protein
MLYPYRYLLLPIVLYLGYTLFVVGYLETNVPNQITGASFLDSYNDGNGIKIYNGDSPMTFNMGKFLHDLFKVQANPTIIEKCKDTESFRACINEEYENDPALQATYESDMADIKEGLTYMQSHGMDYSKIPVFKDFLDATESP